MSRTMHWLRFAIIPLGASMLLAQYAPPPNGESYDSGVAPDPGHGVARISVLNGEVSVKRGDSGDLVAAVINAPVLSQDRLLTSSESRAEIQLDYANMLRVG